MIKGHNPKIKEKDIAYGFKTYNRTEKFDLGLDTINAHTFKIMEIIEQEKTNVEQKQNRKIQGMMKE